MTDARKYLDEKKVAELMERLTGELIEHRPANPEQFIYDYLAANTSATTTEGGNKKENITRAQHKIVLKNREPGTTNMDRFDGFAAQAVKDRPDHCAKFWTELRAYLEKLKDPTGWKLESDVKVIDAGEEHDKSMARIPHLRGIMEVNPTFFAQQWELDLNAVLTEMFHATRVGMLRMFWGPRCARCSATTHMTMNLEELPEKTQCPACRFDNEFSALRQIKLCFDFHPEVFYMPMTNKPCYYTPKMKENMCALKVGMPTVTKHGFQFPPMDLEAGTYTIWDGICNGHVKLVVKRKAEEKDEPIVTELRVSEYTGVPYGEKTIELEHGKFTAQLFPDTGSFCVMALMKGELEDSWFDFSGDAWTTAENGVNHPVFQEYFKDQVVSGDSKMEIEHITLCFTDVVGSTAQYAKLGDGPAMSMVQHHFEILFKEIRQREGRVVKTVGDAVMAVFLNPVNALNAFIEGIRGLEEYQKSDRCPKGGSIQIRVGMHTGRAIVVPLNGINDYFGQNVNTAARIEGKSKPNKILITESVLADSGVAELVEKLKSDKKIETEEVEPLELKGVDGKVKTTLITIL